MDRDKGPSKRQTKRLSSLTKLAGTSALKAGDVDSPERRKKVKVRSSRRLSKDEDNEKGEDDLHLPLLATSTSLSSRRRVRLSGKALETCSTVDPARVPRKLRSEHHTITKDEEEIAEALFVLATVLPDSKTSEVDERMLQEKLELKPTSASLSEGASKEAAQLSFLQEESGEATKVEESIEPALSKQPPILAPNLCVGLATAGYQHQKWSSSNKSVALSNSINCSTRLWPTENGFLSGKLLIMPTNTKCGWKRCAIHVHITHLIHSSQSKDKKYKKFKKVTKINDALISKPSMLKNGSNGVISSGTDNSAVDRAPKDTRLLHDQQESTSSGILSQIVKSCDFQLESADQMSVPFPLPFISNIHVPPFPTPTHTEPEQISAAAAQQIPQSHGAHDGGGGGSLKQYQEMWQVQLTSYGGRMKLQNCAQSQHIRLCSTTHGSSSKSTEMAFACTTVGLILLEEASEQPSPPPFHFFW
ncbi:hypothetical protein QJS10_CPB15g00493 [Acorus calamus]|uniref:Uncharacterized protein n=1 Tax=Acorus calamus TaxID=4465 RepID=A0AAV9DAZ8_ACOCL|nr:hypothetical protein QJS10_CPB15g00493 [Acorus calamus]